MKIRINFLNLYKLKFLRYQNLLNRKSNKFKYTTQSKLNKLISYWKILGSLKFN